MFFSWFFLILARLLLPRTLHCATQHKRSPASFAFKTYSQQVYHVPLFYFLIKHAQILKISLNLDFQ